ncbi:3-oxoacyl-ACP reductase [Spirochaetia bacterium]|nr:3-oxoacyl-ACP reductase [Spirochaetia bacterium]
MTKFSTYIKRMFRFVIKGESKTYVRIDSVKQGDLLLNKNIVITGASSGIGYAIARKCLLENGNVLCVARNSDKLIKAVETLKAETKSDKIKYLNWDIADISMYKEKCHQAVGILGGRIDCLVNSAGITSPLNIENCTPDLWDEIFDINLKGLFFETSEFVKHFINQGTGGNIVMIASQAGLNAQTRPYALSKAALIHLSNGLAKELITYNIRVNTIAPGPTVSEMCVVAPDGNLQGDGRGKRIFLPEEIAETALFLLSNTSRCITGEVITCNNGNSIRTDAFS